MMEKMGWGGKGKRKGGEATEEVEGESARPVPRGGDRRRAHPQHSVRRCAAQCGLVSGSLVPTRTSAAELVAGRLERGVRYGIRNVFVSQTGWAQSQTGRGSNSNGLILNS